MNVEWIRYLLVKQSLGNAVSVVFGREFKYIYFNSQFFNFDFNLYPVNLSSNYNDKFIL